MSDPYLLNLIKTLKQSDHKDLPSLWQLLVFLNHLGIDDGDWHWDSILKFNGRFNRPPWKPTT
jgi:hypothetical protein